MAYYLLLFLIFVDGFPGLSFLTSLHSSEECASFFLFLFDTSSVYSQVATWMKWVGGYVGGMLTSLAIYPGDRCVNASWTLFNVLFRHGV